MQNPPVVALPEKVDVVNIGLPLFETSIRDQGVAGHRRRLAHSR